MCCENCCGAATPTVGGSISAEQMADFAKALREATFALSEDRRSLRLITRGA